MSSVQERLDRMINGTGTASSGAGSSVMERLDRMINHSLPQVANKNDEDSAARWPSQSKESTKDLLPSFATPSGGGKSVENILGKFSDRGGVEAIKSPDSWSSTGDAELGLKAWSNQLDGYEKKLTELSGSIANTENRLKNLQTTVKTAEDAAAYDELYAGYEKMIADYNGVVNDINRVQDKYSAGIERYRDILSGGMERADAAAAEAKRLEDENSRLQQQANLIRIYEMSGTSSSSAAAPIEAQIEQNAERIKKLRAEENQNKMQYYSSLALMEDYAGLSSPASVTGDSRYEYINDIDNARYRNEHTTDPSGAPVALRRYQYLTEDEIKIYNYLYASQGKDAADRFLEDMGPALTERQGAAQYEELGALGKALYWIPAGLDQFGSGIRQLFQREAVPVSSTQITSQLIQQEAQEKSPVLGTLYTLGTTLSNMAPSILASALGSWALGAAGLSAGTASAIGRAAGGTALGASAGGNAYTQKLNEGYSPEAARNYATLVGASEGALQYLLGGIGALSKSGTGRVAAKIAGLDNALGRVARTVSGSTAARLLGSMISEGTEEGLQELLEPAFAAIIFDEEYEADFEDAAYAFLLGALSAGIIEGPAAIDYARRPAGFSFRDMDGYADNGVDYFEGANTLEEVEARYRDLARQYHPDLGGDAATMAEINRQRTMARAFFRGRAEAAAADEAADTTPEAAANTERADGVIRRLTAGRTTEETTPETAGAQIEDQIYAEAGGIVLPTADTAGDFSPRVEVGETVAPTLEAPRAAAPETNAAGNIVLPTADEIMNGGIQNGQQGQEWQQRRNQVSDGDGGRLSGQRARVEAGELARGAEQAARPTQQVGTALARQARVRALRLERVSSASLGLENGTEARSLQVIPETAYDDELRAVSADVYRRTGQRVTFVVGNIQVRAAGKTRAVRGVWTPGGIYVQADNAGYSAAQIAAHEVYHDLAANTPGLDADVKQRIIERYGEDEFRRVAQVYIERLRGVYDVPDGAEHDPALMDKYFASILQEIYADAYAGINAFGAHAERFADPTRETVKERTGIRSRENDDATRDRTGPPAERYSYAGTNAANADLEALEVAKGMAEQNVSAETIRQATGWFQGADGKWRFEIDDSGMRYSARGDLNYGDPDYWRYRELLDKLEREMLGTGSEAVTEAERAEYEELAPRYRDFYRQPGVRGDGSATSARLSDYIQHEELFEQYPQLMDARLVFEDMEDGKQGSYNPDTNTITLSESLQNSERDDALVHEIQHAIQEAEGFARGASPQYWARREYESGDLVGERLRREHDNLFRSLSQEEQNQFTRYRELDRELNRTMFAELGTEEAADYERYEAEQDALYAELYGNEWFRKLLDLERRMDDIPGEYRVMYSNTSGEIEARDAEARRKLTANERRAAPPDLGNEDTIFAQSGAGVQASIDYDTDNRPYVTVEEDILNGVPEKDWARKVKAVLREKFPDGITVGNSEINIGGRTGRELTWSGTSRWLRANDPVAFADKYRTANNADELLLASTDYVNEGLDHPRRDDITDFSRGKVQFRIGDRDYTADVIVAALKDGRLMLYDITHLTRTEIQNRSQPRRSTNPSPGTASYTATDSDNSISAFGDNVNARFSVDEDYEREDVPDYFRGNPYWLETEHAAKAAGYPEIDGVQIMPYKTWVRSKEQGNYGFVVGLAPRDRLVVSFWNKDSGKRAVVPLEQTDIEPVQGAYQMEQNELASLLESEPEAVERMELSPEDEAEYQRWLTEKYGFKAGVRANTALLALPKKAQTEYKRSVSRLVNDLGKSLGVPYHAGRSELRPIAEQIADEYFREGTVSEESGAELFEEAYANGIIRDDEFYRENKPILDYLLTTPIRVSETVKSDIADFNDWRKRQFGRLRISEDGRGVHQVYGELSEMAPGFFPEDITNPTDQLERIADVADSIRISERTLDEYYGPDAAEYKRWAYDEFKQQIGRAYESLRTVRQIALEQDAKRAELERLLEIAETGPTEGELDRVKILWDEGKKARRAYERAVRRNLLSDRDRQLLGKLMRGEISAEDLPSTANRAGIAEIYAAKREYEAFAGALKEFNTKRRAALRAQADDILAGASRMKDKRRGASYMRETQERNARYVFDGPTAEKIIETYFTPVHKNEARRTVYKTQLRDRVRELDLDRKARKGDAVSEAAAVQIYGEALDNISMIEEQLKRGGSDWRNGHSLSEWRALVDDLWAKSPGLDKEKITAAVEEFRKIYDELFSLMNQVRIRNGYEPVDYRHGYFPHFDDAKGESLLGRAFKAANMKDVPLKDRLAALVGKGLDVNTEVNALPTSINGLTHTFKPGIRWVGNIMRRQGFDTTFDAVEGFDRYIEGVSDVIYHTDDIQRLRALASQIRYRTTEPGIQAQVDAIRADPSLSEDKKDTDVRAKLEEGKYELSNYVNNIEEYTNLLANKRSTMDRGIEQFIGRDYYNFAKALENRVAANMVAVNPGSWLTNFIPISQAWAEVSAGDILTSMRDTLSAMVKDDGFRTKSDFLTNRAGSDPLVLSWTQDASKILTKPMEWIDMFTSETVVRARYNSNLKLGMSETAAMEEADSFAASLIADRSKGALPTIFESHNPFTKLFTQFQVEVNNQLSYLYRDLPRNLKERGKKSLAVALLKFMLGAWLYDELYEAIVGRRPALDPLNMLNELSGDLFGYALPNTIELAVDMITGNDVSLATERTDAATALANFGKEMGGQLPFIGGLAFDGGRLPIQSGLPDFGELKGGIAKLADSDAGNNAKGAADILDSLEGPASYLLLPFGGGQLSKFVKGVNAVAEGGVYGEDAEGNPTLKYPVERNVKDALTAMVFGTTSTKGGQEWIDRGFGGFSAKQTAAYAALLGGGVDAYDAFDVVMDIKGTEKTETQSANDIKREKISALDISDDLKATLYSNLITDDYDESIDDMLRRGVDWDGIMGVVTNSKYGVERYNKLVDAGVSPGNAARITEALYSLEPEDGKKSVSQVQQYGAIDKLDGLTDEEKLAAIGTIMGTDATTESGNPSQYSKLTDAIESGLSLTDALEQRENGTLDDYLEFYSAGMKSDAAVDAAETLDAMPEDASTVERYLAIAEMPLSERDKDAALSAIMSDSAYEKYQAARSKGIDTYEYVAFLRAISDFSGDGKQQRVWDYINSLPLSTAQKDQLHYAAGYKESSLAKTPWH